MADATTPCRRENREGLRILHLSILGEIKNSSIDQNLQINSKIQIRSTSDIQLRRHINTESISNPAQLSGVHHNMLKVTSSKINPNLRDHLHKINIQPQAARNLTHIQNLTTVLHEIWQHQLVKAKPTKSGLCYSKVQL